MCPAIQSHIYRVMKNCETSSTPLLRKSKHHPLNVGVRQANMCLDKLLDLGQVILVRAGGGRRHELGVRGRHVLFFTTPVIFRQRTRIAIIRIVHAIQCMCACAHTYEIIYRLYTYTRQTITLR